MSDYLLETEIDLVNNYETLIDNNLSETYKEKLKEDIEKEHIYSDMFAPKVFKMLIADVFENLSFDYSVDIFQQIIDMGKEIMRKDRLLPPIFNLLSEKTFVIWLEFFCKYKKYGRVNQLSGNERGYRSNKFAVILAVDERCFNKGGGYPTGKHRKLLNCYDREKENYVIANELSIDPKIRAFFYMLHSAGFYYIGYDKDSGK